MPARLSVHLPDHAALVRVIEDGALITLGRSDDCTVTVAHPSVSRRHAEVVNLEGAWYVRDLDSKNGIRIGGELVAHGRVGDDDWFSIGDVFCQLRALSDEQAVELDRRATVARGNSAAWLLKLEQADTHDALLRELLAAIVELAGCRRGFLIAGNPGTGLKVAACAGVTEEELAAARFAGSSSAVQRAIRERRPVYFAEPDDHAWLKGRASVIGQGLRALVALPLVHEGRLLGVAYADSDDPGKTFTELDAALLEAFAEQAAIGLAARGLADALASLESWLALDAGRPRRTRLPSWDKLAAS